MIKIFITSDHGGESLRKEIYEYLKSKKINVIDLVDENTPTDDYPDFGHHLAKNIQKNPDSKGIAICTSGIGICIAVNRHKGLRAGLINNVSESYFARLDDDINVLCLDGKRLPPLKNTENLKDKTLWPENHIDHVKEIIDTFLTTEFNTKDPKYKRRTEKLDNF